MKSKNNLNSDKKIKNTNEPYVVDGKYYFQQDNDLLQYNEQTQEWIKVDDSSNGTVDTNNELNVVNNDVDETNSKDDKIFNKISNYFKKMPIVIKGLVKELSNKNSDSQDALNTPNNELNVVNNEADVVNNKDDKIFNKISNYFKKMPIIIKDIVNELSNKNSDSQDALNTPNNEDVNNDEALFDSLTLLNVNYTYKNNSKKSLDDVNVTIGKNQFHVFAGENGAGKSTMIKVITGVLPEYEGIITINGENIQNNLHNKSMFSYVPDNAIFPDHLSTFDYLYLFCMNKYSSKATLKNHINNLLKQFDLTEIKKKNPNMLSLGQKKKVTLIRVLLENSKLIILDEPAANLDPTTKIQLLEFLKEIQNQGSTIFISTHLLDDVKKYATHLTLISEGKILFTGGVDSEEFERINHEYFSKRTKDIEYSKIISSTKEG